MVVDIVSGIHLTSEGSCVLGTAKLTVRNLRGTLDFYHLDVPEDLDRGQVEEYLTRIADSYCRVHSLERQGELIFYQNVIFHSLDCSSNVHNLEDYRRKSIF